MIRSMRIRSLGGGHRSFRTNSEYLASRGPGRVASHDALVEQERAEASAAAGSEQRQQLDAVADRTYGSNEPAPPHVRAEPFQGPAAEGQMRHAIARYRDGGTAAAPPKPSERPQDSSGGKHADMAEMARSYWAKQSDGAA